MKLLKKILFLAFVMIILLRINPNAKAHPTPIFDSLTPNLQEIMRLYGEKHFCINTSRETPEDVAEWKLNNEKVKIDGNLYKGHGGPMKLTNEDIESLYNLPFVRQLELEWFNLEDVDITKFLAINNNKTMEFLDLRDCFFALKDVEIRSIINEKGYKVEEGSDYWILWPGVDIYGIIDDGRLKNCH